MITYNELLNLLKIKGKNVKIESMLRYINENNIDISSFQFENEFKGKNVLEFIKLMHSTKRTVDILFGADNEYYLEIINRNPKVISSFFNIYDPKTAFLPSYDMSFLISNEYLEIVPVEWTEKYLFSNENYFLQKCGKGCLLREKINLSLDNDENEINVFDRNITALKEAIKSNNLENTVKKLSEAKI